MYRSAAPRDPDDQPYVAFLDAYPHPAFVLPALPALSKAAPSLHPVYANPAFRHLVLGTVLAADDAPGHAFFTSFVASQEVLSLGLWLIGTDPTTDLELRPQWFPPGAQNARLTITKTVMNAYIVCTTVLHTTIPQVLDTAPARRLPGLIPNFPDRDRSPSTPCQLFLPDGASSVAMLMETFDWASSPLGPREKWPQSLVSALGLCMSAAFPSAICWGPEKLLMYNEAYIDTAGTKHPQIFGQAGAVAWAELWEKIGPLMTDVYNGATIWKQNDLLFFNRLGPDRLPEENYYSFSYRPIPQEDGKIGGLLNDAFDTTKKVISDRRTNMLRDLIRSSIIVTSKTQFAASILQILSKPEYAYDVPFAGLYMCSVAKLEHADQLAPASATYTAATTIIEQAPKPTSCTLELAGTVGVATGHTAFPDTVELWLDNKTGSAPSSQFASALTSQLTSHTSSPMNGMTVNGSEKFARLSMHSPASTEYSTDTRGSQRRRRRADLPWPFEEAAQQRTPMLVPILNEAFVEGIDRRAWGDRPREAIVMPVGIDDDDTPRAMLILGLNTRRPYDENYQESMEFMRVTLGSALHAVLAREEDSIRAERLADLDAAKTSFFSNVSHELRTPLTLIGGPLDDCVAKLPEGSALRSSLRMASRNVQRLSRLVDSLMDFSKLAARRLEGAFRPVLLGPFVADLASMFRDPIEKSGMQYDVECDLSPDQPLCYIDPEFWEKIVFNLIGNAFKYTMSGTITIRVSFDATQATFSVQDTGIGIPAADMEKIFNRFHRVQCVSRSFEGTGIGLSLTKELVHLHGGELTVESHDDSHDDHGSTFAVSLPLGKDHLPPGSVHLEEEFAVGRRRYGQGIVNDAIMWSRTTDAGDHTPASDAGSLASDASGTGSGGSKLDPATMFFKKTDIVLIADDNSEMRHYMKTILAPYCTVVEASNGKEALELAIQKKPHVVLSDVMMPVMDGFALLGALQEHPATRLLPVILVTAKSGDDSRVEGLLSGADDYLAKPFRSAELVARVHLQMQLGKRRVFLETRFEERTKEVQQLLEQSPVAIFRTDVDGKIVYVNPRWFEMLSQPPGDVDNCIYDEDLAAFKKFWYREHEDDSSEHIIEFRCTDGKWYQGQLAPTDDGGALGTLTDISNQRMFEAAQLEHAREREATARRKAEEAEDRRQEAEQRRRGQELLIDVTSHELRQPVSAILNCSGLVRTNMVALLEHIQGAKSGAGVVLTAEQLDSMREDVEALDAIYQCGLAQERIANDVLSLSRMQLDSLNIQAVDFELVTETQRIVSIFRNEAKMHEINLSVHFGESLANLGVCVVRSDKSRYAQFTDSSPNRRDIRVDMEVSLLPPDDEDSAAYPRVARQNERLSNAKLASGTRLYIYVSVTDSGPGLQPDDLAVLFRRFQQGSLAAKSDVFGGSGLGLFVSRKLCDLMGGRIAVQSELGKGAVFSFFIESFAASVSASPNGSGQRSPPALSLSRVTSHGEMPMPNFAQSPLRVLITEDNLINQLMSLASRQLVKAGCTTVLANNGQQALDCLTSAGQPFDAVLMDIEMPVMDGIEAVRRIRQMEADGELRVRNRVYALTANAREGQVRLIKEAGMDAVLIKPYRIEDVIKAIRGVYSP
ncbi:hypothetical protein BD626DRAFT_548830 [Schizophyllum amplum]|uniref:histidine kinase n=1 Tax=Schizophyllum amplum TaxID=97359 RepID=A0A550CBC8_9AGAR|nr:hypothetical protein BD626DRAFT_548830 [Auriculariopsis ampla]